MTNDSDPATRERLRALLDRVPVDARPRLDQLRSGAAASERQSHRVSGLKRVLIAACALALSFFMVLWLGEAFRSSPPQRPQAFAPCAWSVVPSPNYRPASRYNYLLSVSADAPTDAWAIGSAYRNREGGPNLSTILHWDGSAWHLVGTSAANPYGISADTPSNVWTVGTSRGGHAVASRFDGSTWHATTLADPQTKFWNLNAIHAVSPTDVWAVGGTADNGSGTPLIEHWDGSRWSIIATSEVPTNPLNGVPQAGLWALAVAPDGTVWAVGEATTTTAGPQQPLILRGGLDGSSVVPAPAPVPGKSVDWLFGVSSSGQLTEAVGSYSFADGYGGRLDRAFALAWDGTRWTTSELPIPSGSSRLDAAASRGDQMLTVGSYGAGRALVLARSVSGWTRVQAPSPKGSHLQAISVAPDGSVWAVGSRTVPGGAQRTLTMRCA